MITRLGISRTRLAFILGGLAMFGPFSIDTVFPAFPPMEHDLAVDKIAMQQTISVYLLGYALMSLMHGPISDAVGRKRVILSGIAVFIVASIGCALAQSMPVMLFFRAVQGLSAGVGLIVGRAVVRDALDGHDAQKLMSQISMIFGVAPAIAPVVGGWILGWSSWHMIFWFLTAFSVALFVLTAVALPETHPTEKRLPLHPRALMKGYEHILKNGRFRLLALAGTANFGALFLYISSAPAFVLNLLKLNAQQFVLFFAPTIGGMIFGAFLSGRAAGRMKGTRLANFGFAVGGVATAFNLGYNYFFPQPTLPWAIIPTALIAFGVALVFPILTLSILDMYPNARGSASSMQAFVGLLSNALIAGVLSALLSDSGWHLALGAAAFSTTGYVLWRWYLSIAQRTPSDPVDTAAALEPTEI
jgi:DHA1 family bicyclomycin/chloramphenicol resistance-like MFS transporter